MKRNLANVRFVNLDADESIFFGRELEHVKARSYDVVYPEFMAREMIPVSHDAGPGAESISYEQYDVVGIAKLISNYADDLPRVDVKGKLFTSRVKSLGAAYGYNVQEIRAARQAGKPLEQRRANAAKRAINQLEDEIACNGDSDNGLGGFFTHPNVTDVAIPTDGTGSSALWANKTADLILRDMNLLVETIVDLTKGVHPPNTLALPLAQFHMASTLRVDNTGKTVLQHFLANSPFVKEVKPWNKLKGAGVGGTDLMICYRKDPEVLTFEIPQEYEQFPPQERGLEYVVPCHARNGGVIIYYPLAIAKGDGI